MITDDTNRIGQLEKQVALLTPVVSAAVTWFNQGTGAEGLRACQWLEMQVAEFLEKQDGPNFPVRCIACGHTWGHTPYTALMCRHCGSGTTAGGVR